VQERSPHLQTKVKLERKTWGTTALQSEGCSKNLQFFGEPFWKLPFRLPNSHYKPQNLTNISPSRDSNFPQGRENRTVDEGYFPHRADQAFTLGGSLLPLISTSNETESLFHLCFPLSSKLKCLLGKTLSPG